MSSKSKKISMNKSSQIQFANRCAVLLESGISLSETLSIIIKMDKKSKKVLEKVREDVERGMSLAKSMQIIKVSFDPTLISMISNGESSGILALSLRQAREIMEKRNELLKKIVAVLIYPSLIASATLTMTLFLVMYIFPKILPLLSSMDVELPLLTLIIKRLYEFLFQYGIWLCICLILTIGIFIFFYKKKVEVRYKTQIFIISLPGIGLVIQKYFICSYFRSAGTLLECGQVLPAILEQCIAASTLEPYRRALEISKKEVREGVSLSQSLRSFETIFPPIVPDMLSIGERTGSLASMFHHINRMYEQDLDYLIKHVSASIEPVLMITMGLIVGSVALSIILPIYEITNHLNR